jgi:hypothetical protein
MQNPVVLLNGYGLAFFHCIPLCFREQADLGALSQENMPLGCAKAFPHTRFIAPLLPKPRRSQGRKPGQLTLFPLGGQDGRAGSCVFRSCFNGWHRRGTNC